ncbi:hypothetical protein A2767_03630 [Candidatus Roizmanbacteria bacterium RIFCSPHIGHO2_01_FULL_35_10]|nr:MAG: hypothetical protein A2767_03630 [Candidatus Roizmanbacteria bacterium RIFCSPHIGHO2_01_FULL_35_10]
MEQFRFLHFFDQDFAFWTGIFIVRSEFIFTVCTNYLPFFFTGNQTATFAAFHHTGKRKFMSLRFWHAIPT